MNEKNKVRLTQVYRINGRLVVANSIEGAINTWREWNQPNCPDIRSIERMGNDSYQTVGDDALVIAEELCGDNNGGTSTTGGSDDTPGELNP